MVTGKKKHKIYHVTRKRVLLFTCPERRIVRQFPRIIYAVLIQVSHTLELRDVQQPTLRIQQMTIKRKRPQHEEKQLSLFSNHILLKSNLDR